MKFLSLAVFCIVFYAQGLAQTKFESGYFSTDNGKKTECLILNADWGRNPKKFEYKLSEDSEVKTASIDSVAEFSMLNVSKYKRFKVSIDRSSSRTELLSPDFAPLFNEETLFLKTLVDGKATLYNYVETDLLRFFYSVNNTDAVQLVYKKYMTIDNVLGENNSFRQQLLMALPCSKNPLNVEQLGYDERSLTKYFTKYNACENATVVTCGENSKRNNINFSVKAGVNNTSFSVSGPYWAADFGSKSSLRLGVETEFIIPFRNGNTSFIFEPTYQSFKSEILNAGNRTLIDYASIEFPLGIRRYILMKPHSKLYVNAMVIFDAAFKTTVSDGDENQYDISSKPNLGLGIGYNFRKYIAELRVHTPRKILSEEKQLTTKYNTVSFMVGYQIF